MQTTCDISGTVEDIEVKLLLGANTNSFMRRRLAQQRMTLSDVEWLFRASRAISAVARGVYIKGGWESNLPHFWKLGVDGLVILGFDRLLLVVALGIPVMPIVNRDYLKPVLLYVNVNNT